MYTLKKLQTFAGTMKRSPGTNATTNNTTSSTTATEKGRWVRNVVGFAECKDYRWGLADESHVGVAHFPCSYLNFPLREKKMQQQKTKLELQATCLPAKHVTSSYKKYLRLEFSGLAANSVLAQLYLNKRETAGKKKGVKAKGKGENKQHQTHASFDTTHRLKCYTTQRFLSLF